MHIKLQNIGIFTFFLFVIFSCNSVEEKDSLKISYPKDNTVFPPEIPAPSINWSNSSESEVDQYAIRIYNDVKEIYREDNIPRNNVWHPSDSLWSSLKSFGFNKSLTVELSSYFKKRNLSSSTISFSFSDKAVGAPILFRGVPLPFKFARENLNEVGWFLGDIGSKEKPQTMLENIPVCGNCHSVSTDGKYLAMDVDARDEKGAYAIALLEEETVFSDNELINWSDFVGGEFTYGLLSQISPDGRYVVSTLKDCEIFVDRNNMEYSQLFFPFKGILSVYDTKEKKYFELEGANDTMLVQSNPSWSPDGKYIYFSRSTAAHFEESGIMRGSLATNFSAYNDFLNGFLSGEVDFKFDIYRIPFNNGQGGKAEPVPGASLNGKSNYFPRFTPDGKWIIFCQANSFMLLMPDSKLYILPVEGGEPRLMNCNTDNMNSWHSISPNGNWMVFSSKEEGAYTQLYLTKIDEDGSDYPSIKLENFTIKNKAANIPEFVNIPPGKEIKISPDFLEDDLFAHRMGEIESKAGNLKEAIDYFDSALEFDSNNHKAWHGKGHIMMMMEKPDDAFIFFNNAIRLAPNVSKYYITRGNAYMTIENDQAAMSDFNKAVELDIYSFIAISNRGMLKRKIGDYKGAENDFRKALVLNQEAGLTMVNLGALLAQQGRLSESLDLFTNAISLNPNDLSAYFARAKAYSQLKSYSKAIDDFGIIISIDGNNAEAYFQRGQLFLEVDQNAKAINDINTAANLNHKGAIDFLRRKGLR